MAVAVIRVLSNSKAMLLSKVVLLSKDIVAIRALLSKGMAEVMRVQATKPQKSLTAPNPIPTKNPMPL